MARKIPSNEETERPAIRSLPSDEAPPLGVSRGTAREFLRKFKKFAARHGMDPDENSFRLIQQRRTWQQPEPSLASD
jgi:hypothetical protein